MKLQITILKNRYGSLFACAPYELFQFEYRGGYWYFWLRTQYDPDMFPGKTFPKEFFENACRARYFIMNGGPMPVDIEITEGEELIEKQTRKRR